MTRLRPSAFKELDDHPVRGAASFRNRFFMSLTSGCSASSSVNSLNLFDLHLYL